MLISCHVFSFNEVLLGGFLGQMLLQELHLLWISDLKAVDYRHFELWNPLWLQNAKAARKITGDSHKTAIVLKHGAVVGCTKDGDKLSVCEELVAIINDQVASADKIYFVLFTKFVDDILIEGKADSSLVFLPLLVSLLGVTPEQIA